MKNECNGLLEQNYFEEKVENNKGMCLRVYRSFTEFFLIFCHDLIISSFYFLLFLFSFSCSFHRWQN